MKYYTINNFYVVEKVKELSIWNDVYVYRDMHNFMKDTVASTKDYKTVDIITGGVDSRTVLSHLESLGVEYDLAISGSESMNDVKIAKQIANRLGKEIHISDEIVINADTQWLKDLFISTDGVTGIFSHNRLHNKNVMLKKLGFQLEFGGVGGEFYKNSFLNQDFPFYNGKISRKNFYKLKINTKNFDKKYLTQDILNYANKMENKIINELFYNEYGDKSKVYFRVGHKILRYRMVTLSNCNSISIPSLSPFMENDMLKLTYNKNPWDLEVNKWQRNEVSKYCKEIANINTDRGLTLSNNKVQIYKELFQSYGFLFKVALKRMLHKKDIPVRLDAFIKGRELKEFQMAMNVCKELYILSEDCNINDISDVLADRLMTIGLVYMNFQNG
jgi:hypothetical protein